MSNPIRKLSFLLTALTLFIGLPVRDARAEVVTIPVPLIGQQTNMWCWATTLQMSVSPTGAAITQCSQANARFGRADCCNNPTPAACVQGGWPDYNRVNYNSAESVWGVALTFAQIKAEIKANRPVNFSWGWTGGGGHIMVAKGINDDNGGQWVLMNDPWPPNGGTSRWITYADYVAVAGQYSHWRDYSGISPRNPPLANTWVQMAGPAGATLKQISVGSSNFIWGLDTGGFLWTWNGTAWVKLKGSVSTISAAADGTVWATNPPDSMRVLKWDPIQVTWTWNIPTGMKQVTAMGANKAWGLDDGGSHFEWTGTAWTKKGCCVSQISAGTDGELWATNPADSLRVLRWNGTQWTWAIPTGMTYVSVGNAANIWALDGSDQVFKWNGTAWQKMPGMLRNLSAAADGTVWGINSGGLVYRWIP